mgnify:CR=1 FL=1
MQPFKLRASASGQFLSNPRNKTDLISAGAKTYVQTWLKEQIYGVKKEIDSKYLKKGVEFEDEAIDKAIEWLDLPLVLKNEKHFENDYFTGTPDLILEDTVIDIKNSWDCFTFPLFENECPNKDYYAQLQVYMHLTGLKKAALVYVLLDTPETYSTPEIKYDGIEKKYRIKRFDFDYDEELINKLILRVKSAREYIKTIAV